MTKQKKALIGVAGALGLIAIGYMGWRVLSPPTPAASVAPISIPDAPVYKVADGPRYKTLADANKNCPNGGHQISIADYGCQRRALPAPPVKVVGAPPK